MRFTVAAAAIGIWLAVASLTDALARDLTPAQKRMQVCNSRAKEKGLQGTERGKFMNACLDGSDKPASTSVRQQRHDQCNAVARERRLDGAERRGYTTECEKPPAVKNASARDTPRDCERRADGRRLEGDDRRAYVKGCLDAAREAHSEADR
jgi:psiF repeat